MPSPILFLSLDYRVFQPYTWEMTLCFFSIIRSISGMAQAVALTLRGCTEEGELRWTLF